MTALPDPMMTQNSDSTVNPPPLSQGSLTEHLAQHLLTKPITDTDRRMAAAFVLDAVANALGGRASEPGRIVRAWYRSLDPTAVGARDPGREAFVMGALTHILEVDDLHRASVVHPGCVVVPAAWAAARHTVADGTAFLDAVIRGFEACCRIGMGVGPAHYKTWHNTATCGPFGAAAAVGSLLTLDAPALVHALGNAGTQSAGLWEFLDTGAMSKHLHAGRAAEAGFLAASLAAHGFTGPPKILEGERGFFQGACPDAEPDRVLSDLEAPWQIHLTSIKPWPSCRHTHPAIDAAQDIRAQIAARDQGADQIGAVHVRSYDAALALCDRIAPTSDYEAKFSLQHCVAAALGQDQVDFTAFDAEARKALAPLRARVTVMTEPLYQAAYPTAWGSAVSVTLRDGTRLDARRTHAKGDPEARLSIAELSEKAQMLFDHGAVANGAAWVELLLNIANAPTLPDLRRSWAAAPEPQS